MKSILLMLLCLGVCYAGNTYDYIVVGAGTTGCTVAGKLVEQGHTVLLLEEGPDFVDPLGPPNFFPVSMTPHLVYRLWDTPEVSNRWKSEKVQSAANRRLDVIAGRGSGGTSRLGSVYSVPSSTEFDLWGIPGWSGADMSPYFVNRVAGVNRKGPTGSLVNSFLSSLQFLGFPSRDFTTTATSGDGADEATYLQALDVHIKVNAHDLYTKPLTGAPNFHYSPDSLVTRVIIDVYSSPMVAIGVEYKHNGQTKNAYVNREVILSAGVYGTPKILELSGIGDPVVLQAKNIPLVAALPQVGENFISKLGANMIYLSKTTHIEQSFGNYYNASDIGQYATTFDGFFSYFAANAIGVGTSPGSPVSDFSFEHNTVLPPFQVPENSFLATCISSFPIARGSVHIHTTDAADNPEVTPGGFHNSGAEIGAILYCINVHRGLAQLPPLSDEILMELLPSAAVNSIQDLAGYITTQAVHTYHDFGTASLGLVVNPADFKVLGFDNLRVADASIIPSPITGPLATMFAIGEKLASHISSNPLYQVQIDMTRGNSICNGFHGYQLVSTPHSGDTDVCKSIGSRPVNLVNTGTCDSDEAATNIVNCLQSEAWIGQKGTDCRVLSQSEVITVDDCSVQRPVLCKR